jgi:hypothetical protein
MVLFFLLFVSITPFAFGLEEEINIELDMNESFKDTHEITEEFLKEFSIDLKHIRRSMTTIVDVNEQFANSYKPDIPFPPPKTV